MNKETVKAKLGTGWHNTIDQVYAVQEQLSFCPGIYLIERKNGMLRVIYKRTDLTNQAQEFILSSIEYRFERLTAKLCEDCGVFGLRRTELPEVRTLCTRCYAFAYSNIHPVPSLVANQEPHID